MFIKPSGFDDLVAHCCAALHESYRQDGAFVPYQSAPAGIREKTRRDVETVLIAVAQRSTCLLLPAPVTA